MNQVGVLITAERELDLTRRAKAGDRSAMSELITAHEGFFRQMVMRSGRRPEDFDFDDAVQEARIAAMHSVKNFDPDRGNRFLTFAGRKVAWTLIHLRDQRGAIRLPQNQSYLAAEPGRRRLADCARRMRSLADPVGPDEAGGTLGMLLSTGADDVVESLADDERRELVRRAIQRLDPRQRAVIQRRFDGGDTLEEIGQTLGLTKERVRQIERQALRLLAYLCEPLGDGAKAREI